MIGSTLGGYRIVEQIGRGGMATVFKAFDPLTERYVAIKTLPEQYLKDETFRARFEQEAKSIARLEHVHILPMFAYGEEGGITYIVMRYLDTGTLAEYIQSKGALPLSEAAQILAQIASALSYAHQNNVLHRDIKPSNILMDNQGNAFLTDFGIAKMVDGSGLDLTGTGLIGTPKYMSPEQCLGKKDLTPASDQYALGIILYEMVTGQAPFDAETPLAVIQQHVSAPLPPPRTYRRDLPEAAQNVLLKALARQPEARYSTCNDFADAFSEVISVNANVTQMPDGDPTIIPSNDATATISEWEEASVTTTLQPEQNGSSRRGLWIGGLAIIAIIVMVFGAFTLLGNDKNSDGSTPPPSDTEIVDNAVNPTDDNENVIDSTETATLETEPSATATEPAGTTPAPTATVDIPTPMPTLQATAVSVVNDEYTTMELVANNRDWEPVIREFEYDGYTVPMALVPRGCYQMGNDPFSSYYDVNSGTSGGEYWLTGISDGGEICFDEPFWLDVYEVSNEQFNALTGQAISEGEWTDDQYPRDKIKWDEALTFCTENRSARLPTETEWEYAARGPDDLYHTWGNESGDDLPLNYCDVSCYDTFFKEWANRDFDDGYGGTAPIDTYPTGISWVGAYNMNGNVWEWVSTIYDLQEFPYPYDATDGREDLDVNFSERGLRGGSWEDPRDKIRSTTRLGLSELTIRNTIGFRCARSYSGMPELSTASANSTDTDTNQDEYLTMEPIASNDKWEPVIREFEYDGYSVPMALVPQGCYHMGNDPYASYYDWDGAGEWGVLGIPDGGEICFDEPFWIDVYEVSNEQFNALNGQATAASEWADANLPREKITWSKALEFCAENRDARLLTEAEWEYAARGPDNLYQTWGNALYSNDDTPPLNYCEGACHDLFLYEWADRNRNDGFGGTAPIDAYEDGISWVGAYNMNGNVWEWVSTIYDLIEFPYPYDATDGREDLAINFVQRGLRGGSYDGNPDKIRNTTRYGLGPLAVSRTVGFRCARDYQ